MRVRFILYFLYCLIFSLQLSASEKKPAPVLKTDSSMVAVRQFDKNALKEYAADRAFHYNELNTSVSPSLWERFWSWFWSLFRGVVSNAGSGGTFKYLFFILGCAGIIFAAVELAGMNMYTLFTGKPRQADMPYTESLENIHEISFDTEIGKAVLIKDYRLAVRLLYLKSLKRLSDSGRIHWEIDKTNMQYINELKNADHREIFRELTFRFEYIWYGGFPVNEDSFARISDSFRKFNASGR